MKRLFLSFATLFILMALSCGQQTPADQSTRAIKPVGPEKFQEQWIELRESARLIDVRTPQEFDKGHLPEAELIDFLENDFKQKIAILDKQDPVLVYCRSGNRSDRAAEQMEQMGFERIITLTGGILAWEKNGLPVE